MLPVVVSQSNMASQILEADNIPENNGMVPYM